MKSLSKKESLKESLKKRLNGQQTEKLVHKRKLTSDEIQDIVSFIRPSMLLPYEISNSIVEKYRDEITSQLKQIEIYPQMIPILRQRIESQHRSTIIAPGESVGIITAQSLVEKQSQSALSAFHKAGAADLQQSARFGEILNASNKPKGANNFIYLTEGNKSVKEIRNTINHSIVQLSMKKICKDYDIHINKIQDKWYDAYNILYSPIEEHYRDCIVFKINMEILFEYRLTLKEVSEKIQSGLNDIACIFSPDSIGEIHVYVDTRDLPIDEDDLRYKLYINEENKVEVYFEDTVVPVIKNMIVCGIPGIMNMFFDQNKETKTWFIETENSNEKPPENNKFKKGKEKPINSLMRFKKVLSHPKVDSNKTISNNIWDIFRTFGIEAVRQYIVDEFIKIMEGTNLCHITLLVDKMTYLGTICSISRYTMRKDNTGPLSKASFEETLDNLLKSAIFSQEETTKGLSASIICGKRAAIGTGMSELTVDMNKLLK